MDDRLYVLLHKNFRRYGLLGKKERQFEKPKLGLGMDGRGIDQPSFQRKKFNKRVGKKQYSMADRKGFRRL